MKTTKKRIGIFIQVKPELYSTVKEMAEKRDLSATALVRLMIEAELRHPRIFENQGVL